MGEIVRHPNYWVSDDGIVYRKEKQNFFKLRPDYSNGYARVDLDGRKEYVGKLVLETFEPNRNLSHKVFYIDGDHTNNNLHNLIWLSPSDIQLYSNYSIEYRTQLLRGHR